MSNSDNFGEETKQAATENQKIDLSFAPSGNFLVSNEAQLPDTNDNEASQNITFDTTEEESDGKKRKIKRKEPQPYFLIFSLLLATIWIIGAILYLSTKTSGISNLDVFTMVVALLGPAGLSVLAGLMGEALTKSNREAKALVRAARRIMEPSKAAEESAKSTLSAVREEVERLENAIHAAATHLGNLENTIEIRSISLRKATDEARFGANTFVSTMENERVRLASLLEALSDLTKSAQLTTKNATQGIDEKAELLTKAVENIASRSNEVVNSASFAANRLDEALNKTLDAISSLDQASSKGEVALARVHDLMVLARVRADDAVGGVSDATQSLHDAANKANETAREVSQLIARETQQTRVQSIKTIEDVRKIAEENAYLVAQALKAETDKARMIANENMAALDATSNSIKRLAVEANEYVNKQLGENRAHIDSLRQQTFELGQESEKFVDNRVDAARNLVEQSSSILEEAGKKIEDRFNSVMRACSDQARAVEDVIDGLNRKLESLPSEAAARAQTVELALEETLNKLNETGRKAAEETRALDDAFQNRLRESYSALGEVVQRLGGLSGVFAPQINPISTPAPAPVREEVDLPNLPLKSQPSEPKKEVPVENPKVEKPQPITPSVFGSVLSPNIPVRSAPTNIKKPEEPKLPIQNISLRGTISQETTPENNSTKPQQAPIEPKNNPQDYNPFGDVSFTNRNRNETNSDWSWRDILSAIDSNTQNGTEANLVQRLISELELGQISQVIIDRLHNVLLNNIEKVRVQTSLTLPREVATLKRYIERNDDIQKKLENFVKSNIELAKSGQLGQPELRLLLVADSALNP